MNQTGDVYQWHPHGWDLFAGVGRKGERLERQSSWQHVALTRSETYNWKQSKSHFLKVSILNLAPQLLKEDEGCFLVGDAIGLRCHRQWKMCAKPKKSSCSSALHHPCRLYLGSGMTRVCVLAVAIRNHRGAADNYGWSTGVQWDAPKEPALLRCAVRNNLLMADNETPCTFITLPNIKETFIYLCLENQRENQHQREPPTESIWCYKG